MAKTFALVAAIVAVSAVGVFGLAVATRSRNSAQPSPAPAPAPMPAPIPAFHAQGDQGGPSSAPAQPSPGHGKHTVTVTFTYDFRKTHACTATITTNCIQQFIVYDISAGANKTKRFKLFSVSPPAGATEIVNGIAGIGPLLDFESGQHLIAVVATEPDLSESFPTACTTWITIP